MGDADSAAELKNELESMRAKFDQQKSGASKAATRPVAAAGTKKANVCMGFVALRCASPGVMARYNLLFFFSYL
jgi:hypothetical protein